MGVVVVHNLLGDHLKASEELVTSLLVRAEP
jgi:hypothetical protein